ncbi:ATP-binding cassette, subfamily C [Selenomonas ruminantium]|uniref:ATP-binding cassette, subfamily C n=2 Tax=Selenomonas ruminantium TaxID=971 RepID=A0A1K1NNQ2_SELRU|nr:ATP-binding cassette, subfamily C [Selenomonas ruminantium]
MLFGAILEALGISAILPLVSVIGDATFLERHPYLMDWARCCGVAEHTSFIIVSALFIMLLYLLKNAYIAWECRLQISFATNNMVYYSRELLGKYLAKPYLFHVNNNTATLIRNVNSGASVAFNAIMMPMFQLLTEIITAATIWLMLIIVDPITALMVAGILSVLLLAILRGFRRKITRQGKVQNEFSAQYIKWLNQGLGAIKETKIMHKEAFFVQEFGKAYDKFGHANGIFNFLNQLPRTIIEAVVVSGLLLLIVIKALMGGSPESIVPLLGMLALAAFRLMPSANRIVSFYNGIKFQQPLFNQLYDEFYAIRKQIEQGKSGQEYTSCLPMEFQDKISVRALAFKYPEGKKRVLKNINFDIPKGSFVGIIGSSGAGKTTFVDILLGLLKPTSGSIYVDGVDIGDNIHGWQENLAYVPQTIYLIDGTIKENIALGLKMQDIDEEKVERAIAMAELADYIATLPDGINTKVGERGVKLSGGQRQRIGIARALYQQPKVLVLDEATSALDNETEKNITETILKLKGKITIIAIAHRTTTLAECDFKVKFINGMAQVI